MFGQFVAFVVTHDYAGAFPFMIVAYDKRSLAVCVKLAWRGQDTLAVFAA